MKTAAPKERRASAPPAKRARKPHTDQLGTRSQDGERKESSASTSVDGDLDARAFDGGEFADPESAGGEFSDLDRAWHSATSGTGRRLPHRQVLESALGYDLSRVRLYENQQARSLLDRLGAHAATRGPQILVRDATPDARTLIHEIVHTVQSRSMDVPQAHIERASSAAEREAERVAEQLPHLLQRSAAPKIEQCLEPGTVALRRESFAESRVRSLIDYLSAQGARRDAEADPSPAPSGDSESELNDAALLPGPITAAEADSEVLAATEGEDIEVEDTEAEANTEDTEVEDTEAEASVASDAVPADVDDTEATTTGTAAPPGGSTRRGGVDARRTDEAAETTTESTAAPSTDSEPAIARGDCIINPRQQYQQFVDNVRAAWDRGASDLDGVSATPCEASATPTGHRPYEAGPPSRAPPSADQPLPSEPTEAPEIDPQSDPAIIRAREQLGDVIAPDDGTAPTILDPEAERAGARVRDEVRRDLRGELQDAPESPEIQTEVQLTPHDDPSRLEGDLSEYESTLSLQKAEARARAEVDPGARRLAPSRDPTQGHDYALSGVDVPRVDPSSRVNDELLSRIPNDDNVGAVSIDHLVLAKTDELQARQAALDREGQIDPAVQQEIASKQEQLREACREGSQERDGELSEATAELEQQQEAWQTDIDSHEQSERAVAERTRAQGDERAGRIKRSAETSCRETVRRADAEARRRWSEARRETDRRITRNSSESLIQRAVRFFQDVVNTVRRAVVTFLESVRRAVRTLFEAARAATRAIIEQARRSIQGVVQWVSSTLRILARNLPGALGRIARRWQARIDATLRGLQARLDAWADALSGLTDRVLTAMMGAVDRGLSDLEARVNAAADALNELLSDGLMAFIRHNFPALATLIEEGLVAPIQRATAALDDWIEGLLEDSGILRLQQALETTQQNHTCEVASEEEVTDLCEGFEMLLQQALEQFDELLESPAARELRASLDEANQSNLEERAGFLSRLFTFAQEAATEVLEWWDTIETGIRRLFSLVGNFACAIWRHVAVALGLPPDLDPITALRQALEALWLEAIERVRPVIDRALELWREIRNSQFVQTLIAVRDGIRDAIRSVRRLWNEIISAGEAWLASIAERFRTELVDPVLRFLTRVGDALRAAVDSLEAFANRLVQRFDEFLARIGQLLGLDSLIRLLQAIYAPCRALARAVFDCILRGLRGLAFAVSNLRVVARRVLDLMVGIAFAFAAVPISIATFLLGNVWTYLVPECMKGPIIDFLLRVLLRVIEFFPVPNDVALAIVYQGVRGFLYGVLAAPTEQKVAAANFVARIFGGDAMVGAGLLVGLLRAVWDSTVGLVLMAIRAVVWLIGLPFRALGITGGDEADEEDQTEDAPEESELSEDEAIQFGPPVEDDAPPASEEASSEEATDDATTTDSEGIDLTQPPELPPEVTRIRELLEAFVEARITQEDLQALLLSLRDRLAGVVYGHAKSLGLRALGALDADAVGYKLGWVVGYIYGLILVMVVLALLTFWAGGSGAGLGAAAGSAGGGGQALAALGQGSSWLGRGASLVRGGASAARGAGGLTRILSQVYRFIRPLLRVVSRLRQTRLGPLIGRLERWFHRMFRWLRVYVRRLQRVARRVARAAQRIWRGLPDWMRDATTTWLRFLRLAVEHRLRAWAVLSAEMNDEMLSEGSLRIRLRPLRAEARRSLPRGVTLQFRAERKPEQDRWRLRCRVRHALFARDVQWQSRLVFASSCSRWAWYATDEQGDSWYSTDESQRREHERAAARLKSLIERALALELEQDPDQDVETLHHNLFDDSDGIERAAGRGLLLEHVALTFDEHHYEPRIINNIVHFVYPYVISPNTTSDALPASTGRPPRREDLPETRVRYGSLTATAQFGTEMTAKPLTHKGEAGSRPTIRSHWWDQLNFRRKGGGSYYVRGHLLNHNIHGPGNTWDNLAPITRNANSKHSKDVEEQVKPLVSAGQEAFEYHVAVRYRSGGPNTNLLRRIDQDTSVDDETRATRRRVVTAEQYLPTAFLCSVWRLDDAGNRVSDPIFDNYRIPNEPEESSPGDYQVSNGPPRELLHLNIQNPYPQGSTSDAAALEAYQRLNRVGPSTAAYMLAHRTEFRLWRHVHETVPGLSAETVADWQNSEFRVQLRGGITRWDPPY